MFASPRSLLLLAPALAACGPSVASIAVSPTTVTLTEKGRTQVLKAEPKDKDGNQVVEAVLKIKWTSSNPAVALVANGVITAVASGEAVVSASFGEVQGSTKVVVSIPVTMALEPAKAEILGVGKSLVLRPVVKDSTGREYPGRPPVVWATSDTKILNVADSTVTAEGPGAAEITAMLGGLSATAELTVKLPPVAALTIEPSTINLAKAGEAVRLKAVATDEKGEEIRGVVPTWGSSDEKVATVTATGQVQAVKKGKATVKATVEDKSVEVQVNVGD